MLLVEINSWQVFFPILPIVNVIGDSGSEFFKRKENIIVNAPEKSELSIQAYTVFLHEKENKNF
jgi:hypothetical protein